MCINCTEHLKCNTKEHLFQESTILKKHYATIPSLQDISSYIIAIELWKQIIQQQDARMDVLNAKDENKIEKFLQNSPVPRSIRELLNESLTHVWNEMYNMADYYAKYVFVNEWRVYNQTIKKSDLLFCVWSSNGKIHYRETALNMLSNPRLPFLDKFTIMCKFNLQDDVKKLPSDSIFERFGEEFYYYIAIK